MKAVWRKIFNLLTNDIIKLEPLEAELAKLFTNSWRYIQFSIANQFYMIAESMGLDFYKIFNAMTKNYPRTKGFPGAGFTAGPCLFKDTMQISSFFGNQFFLGHAAMLVNEGLPNFIVKQLKIKHDLSQISVGILGMAYKGESDDKRESLSYKLKKILEFETKEVLCTDEYIQDNDLLPLNTVLDKADVLIIGAPHRKYKTINTAKEIIDIWNLLE